MVGIIHTNEIESHAKWLESHYKYIIKLLLVSEK